MDGGRSTFAWSMPGRCKSDVYSCVPVTMSRAPTLGALVPATVQLSAGVSLMSSRTVSVSLLPAVSSP